MNLNGKIVTVFGGSGFLGTYVVRALAEAGYTIKIISRNPEYSKALKTAGFVGQVVPLSGNILDYDRLPEYVRGSYAVINLVGILAESGNQKFKKLQEEAPGKLAEAAKKTGVEKFVHVSALVDPESKAEYAKSKIQGEKNVIAAFADAYIVKPSVIFGPEDNFFNMFAAMSNISPFLPAIGGGKTKMQPVYAGDVAEAIARMVAREVKPGAYQIGGPEALTFKQILERIMEYTERKRCILNIPFGVAKFGAIFAPSAILTRDQVELLKHDNVVTSRTKTLSELGITPTAIEAVVPKYLERFKTRKPAYVD